MRRGEIWWAELGKPSRRRPVVLLSRNEAYSARSLVTVAPVTTRIRMIPSEVPLGAADGMPQDCVADLDTVIAIPKECLRSRVTALSAKKVKEVETAVHFALGME